MATFGDFRLKSFDSKNVDDSGKFLGKNIYWKLYSIENIFRVIIYSVLDGETPIGRDWWVLFVNEDIRDKVERVKKPYLRRVWHSRQGNSGIYYVDLVDLNKIILDNKPLFEPIIPEIDKWIVNIEEIKLPRNIISHMNFPSKTDKGRIDILYNDFKVLINLIESKIGLKIPK